MYKIIKYNSIHNKGNGIIEYDTTIVKVITSYEKAVSLAIALKAITRKLYKIERY